MNLLQAAQYSANGFTVRSNQGKRYSPEKLNVKWIGVHYASMNNNGMTDEERKGEWEAVISLSNKSKKI
ncbi:hypothetical protein [Paenibacillus sp. LK1]|uniref:hypothetical protein n=1 Tax=Paenibacillus sp. LK1 TaxID=2053014 RepID=UPI000C19C180|nr:hypothetical protein [Paenibacillus sp. LK1]PIH59018.1 hypothetical protein CS562_13820 [Paenibacillus sp. LK1]